MIILQNGQKMRTIDVVFELTLALERWFPDNNGSFAYGTRLCEEAGELVEAISSLPQTLDDDDRRHLVKEVADVMQIVLGILNIHNLKDRIPKNLSEFDHKGDPQDPRKYTVLVSVRAGEVANSINHMQGLGIKKQKHGNDASGRLVEKSYNLVQLLVWILSQYSLQKQFDEQLVKDYYTLQERGFIAKN